LAVLQDPLTLMAVRSAERFAQRRQRSRLLRWQLIAKRGLDIVSSLILLVALAPVIGIAALLVRAHSPGPAFYAGQRRGWHGRPFACLKLRSMYLDGDAILRRHGLNGAGDQGRLLLFAADPRVTPVGRVIRKLSIDELPQLLNVLRGDMSLIGPRPLALSMLADYDEIGVARALLRPGISGLWQVRNRTKNASVVDMIEDDMTYIEGFSLLLDLKIACLTLPRMIEPPRRRGIQAS
jgi:lipopolysaccharide/colanic/teichoic acid biosynthesis glycosyltransferase